MAFIVKNARKIVDLAYATGSICIWAVATGDAAATVLAPGYFNALRARLSVNDIVHVMAGADGVGDYFSLKIAAVPATGNVTVQADVDVAGGGARAVVPTADGLTTGLILATDKMVAAASTNADHIITLPLASAETRGRVILIYVAASTNCELRTPATSTQTINNVNCDGTQEALLAHSHTYRLTQHLDAGWIMEKLTNLGAVATAVVPD